MLIRTVLNEVSSHATRTLKKLTISFLAFLILFPPLLASAQDGGYIVFGDIWLKAVLNTPSGPVTLVWHEVGTDTTPSGDNVVSGYFYADPNDFAYGSEYNPEIFVKLYNASNGWTNIAFNHVSVDSADVYSASSYSGIPDQSGRVTLNNRLDEHQYENIKNNSNEFRFEAEYTGSFSGDDYGIFSIDVDSQGSITGQAYSEKYGDTYVISGDVNTDGEISMTTGSADTGAAFRGSVNASGELIGTWTNPFYGLRGSFSGNKKNGNSTGAEIDIMLTSAQWDLNGRYASCGSSGNAQGTITFYSSNNKVTGYSYEGEDWHHDCTVTDIGYLQEDISTYKLSDPISASEIKGLCNAFMPGFEVTVTEFTNSLFTCSYYDPFDNSTEIATFTKQ